MLQSSLVEKYKELTGASSDSIVKWYNNGRNSIWIQLANNKEFIFTYNSKAKWSIETLGMFKDNLKK